MKELIRNDRLPEEKQKEIFTASLVHDLKNPLNAQITALEQLLKKKFGSLNSLQEEILNEVIQSGKFMRNLISSLLSVYKFENGAVKLDKTYADIDKIIKECIKEITPSALERSIFIEYTSCTQESMLFCSESYIKRIISNMLSNMILYSYKNTKPAVILEDDPLNMRLIFKSRGIPIKEDLKAHIFDKYSCGANNSAGTGLGLYFCKTAAEAHGGSVELQTDESDTKFIVTLPKKPAASGMLKFS